MTVETQQTIAKPAVVTGKGLFSGEPATLTIHPAEANAGIDFVRTDVGDPVVIPARVRAAMKLIVAHLYEHREELTEMKLESMPFAAKNLLNDRNIGV